MHISNFRPVKRVLDVVKVFARVAAAMDARLVFVGDGPDASAALQLAQELGVADRVVFVGVVDQVAPLLAGADLLLLPSQTESFGLVALEALASGVSWSPATSAAYQRWSNRASPVPRPLGDVDKMAEYALHIPPTALGARPSVRPLVPAPASSTTAASSPSTMAIYERVLTGGSIAPRLP